MADPEESRDHIRSLFDKHNAIHGIYKRAVEALDKEISDIDASQMRPQEAEYCEHMRQSLRQAILIMLYSYLEAGMNLIGDLFVRNYKKEIEKKKKEGGVNARLTVLRNSGITFVPERNEDEIAESLRLIRNCLVHADGRVAKSTEVDAIEKIQKHQPNCQLIENRDGSIFLHDHIVSLANSTSFSLLLGLYDAAKRTGPDYNDLVNDGHSSANPR